MRADGSAEAGERLDERDAESGALLSLGFPPN